jgi:aryl-alcohol dehydrogenase-like predicted oxidoreductase
VAFKEMYHTVAAQPLRDTAHQYSEGLSEEILEQALGPPAQRRADRHQGGLRTSDNLLDAGLSARHLVAATETSLGQTDSQFPRHMAG